MLRTIRSKFILGFFLIFAVFFLVLNQLVAANIESGNRKIITESLIDLKTTSSAYIRQSFLTHHFASDEIYFGQMAAELGRDLQHATSGDVGLYSLQGELLYASSPAAIPDGGGDLAQALQSRTAYTLSLDGNKASVLYAYPVAVDGVKVGVLRFARDFSLLYEQSARIQRTILTSAAAIFAAAFLFSYLLSRHITIPLVKLTKASTEVMNGNLDVRIVFRRRDEIGRLAANFNSMLGKLREQLEVIGRDRDRLAELNQHRKRFYDNMTHELKTPLTTIMGYADMIRANGTRDKELFDKGMTHIADESRRLHELVLRLLEMSKASAASAQPLADVDLTLLLRSVCESMAIKARRYRKTIHCEADEGLIVRGEADKLRQVCINLLDNAIKYGYFHSDIRVTARREAGSIRLAFSNRGDTIGAEQLDKVFEPFYRTDRTAAEAESAGLGLGICKEIVEAHRGTLRITSRQEQTNVEIELPFAMEGERWE